MNKYGVKFKHGVVCQYLNPAIVSAINWLGQFAEGAGQHITITSMNDGKHSDNSFHYKDKAIDIRIWGLSHGLRQAIVDWFNNDNRYDCVLEKDHIHLEVDPK